MTDPRTPDDHHDRERSEERPGDPGVAPPPPPPQWGQAPGQGAHLLPEAPPLPEFGVPLPEPEVPESERTVGDIDISGTMRTQVFPGGEQRPAEQRFAQPPSPGEGGQGGYNPDATIADMSAFMPAAGEQPGQGAKHTREEVRPAPAPEADEAPATQQLPDAQAAAAQAGHQAGQVPETDQTVRYQSAPPPATEQIQQADQTVRYQPPSPFAQPPSLPDGGGQAGGPPSAGPPTLAPFPYAQEPPRPEMPTTQQIANAQQTGHQQPPAPPAPEAPPFAQPPAPQAPEPFPYAQEIPGNKPAAPEPFPYGQEIPGRPQAQAQAGPAPFPYAQEIPGQQPHQAHAQAAPPLQAPPPAPTDSPRPFAPPPQIDEPWRVGGPGGGGDQPGKPKKARRPFPKKPVLIGVGGLAAAALVAAGGLVVLGGGDAGGGDDAKAALAGSVFAADPAPRTDGRDQELTHVAASGTTVVAVGKEADAAGTRGRFLVSSDGGRTFRSADVRDGTGADEVPALVAGSSRGWIAIGSRPGGGVVWTSQDGGTWRRQPDAAGQPFGPGSRPRRAVATQNGFVVMGETTRKGDFSDAEPTVWLSGDGAQWEARVGLQIGLSAKRGKVSLVEVAASGGTVLLEATHAPDAKKPNVGFKRVWRSQDGGRTWQDVNVPAPKGSRGLMIGGGGSGFLAIREVGGKHGEAFASADGAKWAPAGRLATPGYRRIGRIMGADKGFAAVVIRGRDVLVSRSGDGRTWSDAGSLPTQSGRTLTAGALAGDLSVLVGKENAGDDDPMLAVHDARGAQIPVDLAKVPGAVRRDHTVAGIGADASRAVAVGSLGGDAAVWTSTDGTSWTRGQGVGAAFTRPGPQRLTEVVNGKQGWLAVGHDQRLPYRPLVVSSADGAGWQAADAHAAFRPGRDHLATYAAAAGPAGYVVVGEEGLSAATWFSADLKNWERGKGVNNTGLTAQPGSNRWMRGVAAVQSGFVAVGGLRDPAAGNAPGQRPAVWTSADGKQWALKQLPLPNGIGEGLLAKVVAKGGTLVALGSGASTGGLIALGYVSTDGGANWKEFRPPVPEGASEIQITGLTATPKGFAATATSGRQGAADVVAWTSTDGTSWQAAKPGGEGLGGDGDQRITGLAAFKDKLLGVGNNDVPAGEQPVLWSRPVP
ncbi:hypothetical protein ACQEU3_20845 [Spirillospora sp. CA-253888]